MTTFEGLILQPTYRVREGRPVVQLFGRLQNGPAFLVEDDRFRPYFFVRERDRRALAGHPEVEVESTDLRDLQDERVLRVVASVPAAVPPLRERLQREGCPTYEGDVRFAYRYLVDHCLGASVRIEGEPLEKSSTEALWRFLDPDLSPSACRPALRFLSLDLETSPDASRVHSAALVSDGGVEEVHLVAEESLEEAHVLSYPNERRLLAAVEARIRELDPDVLLGWNVVDFDLRVFTGRCKALGIPCHLGRVPGEIAFLTDRTFTRQTRAEIPGRMVLDGISLVRDALRLEDYRLETVARAVLGRGKLLDADAPDSAAEIERLYREDRPALVAYNLEDARLVPEILAREGLLDLCLERSVLSGMQLDRVGASIASFDLLYLPALRARGLVAPSVEHDRESAPVQGGAVLDSRPGVFANVAVFDFQSLYPSLIRTFHLDPLAHARAGEDAIVAPNGARFARDEAILPALIERFRERREAARARGDRHGDAAIKIMMNSLFGVLGSVGCRFFDPGVANAITSFGQQTLRWTRDLLEEDGVTVLYGDTDSVFVSLRTDAPGAPARAEAEALRARTEERIHARIREEYDVEPRLVLQLHRIFDRFFMPRVRGGAGGSKKRYAGWCEGRLEVVGLESVRRDWPAVARRLQEGLLTRLFRDEELLPFVRELVETLRKGELDRELVYTKRVRKGSLERYTASRPPHIQAARKAGRLPGGVVHYLITRGGPEPVFPGRPLPDGIDREHYVDKVLRPVADAVLAELGQSFDEALGAPRQMSLL